MMLHYSLQLGLKSIHPLRGQMLKKIVFPRYCCTLPSLKHTPTLLWADEFAATRTVSE